MQYTIQTARLGLRNWKNTDLEAMYALNQDDAVMHFFPSKPDKKATANYIKRMQKQFDTTKYCYFATELLSTKEFIGFIVVGSRFYWIWEMVY